MESYHRMLCWKCGRISRQFFLDIGGCRLWVYLKPWRATNVISLKPHHSQKAILGRLKHVIVKYGAYIFHFQGFGAGIQWPQANLTSWMVFSLESWPQNEPAKCKVQAKVIRWTDTTVSQGHVEFPQELAIKTTNSHFLAKKSAAENFGQQLDGGSFPPRTCRTRVIKMKGSTCLGGRSLLFQMAATVFTSIQATWMPAMGESNKNRVLDAGNRTVLEHNIIRKS